MSGTPLIPVALADLPERYAFLDPAGSGDTKKVSRGRSRSACVVVAVDDLQRAFVLESWASRENTNDLINRLIRTHLRWQPTLFGVEDVALQKRFAESIEIVSLQRGVTLPLYPVKPPPRQDKGFRIESSIMPYHISGRLFIPLEQDELRYEMRVFPMGERNDLVDALAYALALVPARHRARVVMETEEQAGFEQYLLDSGMQEGEIREYMGGEALPRRRSGVPAHWRLREQAIEPDWSVDED